MTLHWPTLVFQVVNFLVLVALLHRLLFRPLREHMRQRASSIAERLREVTEGRREVEQLRVSARQALEEAQRSRELALQTVRQEADALRAQLLEESRASARQERESLVAHAEQAAARRLQSVLAELPTLLEKLLRRFLEEIGDMAQLHQQSCTRLAGSILELDQQVRDRLRTAARRDGLLLVVAAEPVPAELVQALGKVFEMRLETRVDASLVAGAKLLAGDTVLDGSASAQLARVIEELSRGAAPSSAEATHGR